MRLIKRAITCLLFAVWIVFAFGAFVIGGMIRALNTAAD